MLVYVSGPFSGDVKLNVDRAVVAGAEVMRRGHAAFVPHLYYWIERVAATRGKVYSWEQWMKIDLDILARCDALLYIRSSRGADIELARARELGMPVFMSIEEIPEAVEWGQFPEVTP
jgi:hypothetical protein